ncbi:transcriptional regulator [Lentilactobacillus curieae]|uniref:Transcriptional regulator n=1 Tax=Lentilactobacillus curieae TaxID=1138822 RepID=A0A1S6QIX0_9LACO|nr:helix-turn-helix transcriptional regulator [Lentilactobacillus curieae]AQW21543.1 transcriptional regulator [Lentilactobacillus curieae]
MSKKKFDEDQIINKVYEFRVLSHMSQKDLADAVGVSKQTILVMEKGHYSPSLKLAFRLANYFNVSISDIFSYKEGDDAHER